MSVVAAVDWVVGMAVVVVAGAGVGVVVLGEQSTLRSSEVGPGAGL